MRDQACPNAADLTALLAADTGAATRGALLDGALSHPVRLAELRLLLALAQSAGDLASATASPARTQRGWRLLVPTAGALAVAALLSVLGPREDAGLPAMAAEVAASPTLAMADARGDSLLGGSFEAADGFAGGFEE